MSPIRGGRNIWRTFRESRDRAKAVARRWCACARAANCRAPTGARCTSCAHTLGLKEKRVYLGDGTGANGIVKIVDREKLLRGPREPTNENLIYPQITRLDLPPDVGAHTAFPLLGMDVAEFGMQKEPTGRRGAPPPATGDHEHEVSVPANQTQARRDFIAVVGETLANECRENRQMLRMLDATVE